MSQGERDLVEENFQGLAVPRDNPGRGRALISIMACIAGPFKHLSFTYRSDTTGMRLLPPGPSAASDGRE
jgi:hypothetical protein